MMMTMTMPLVLEVQAEGLNEAVDDGAEVFTEEQEREKLFTFRAGEWSETNACPHFYLWGEDEAF